MTKLIRAGGGDSHFGPRHAFAALVLTPPIPVVLPLVVAALLAAFSKRMPDWLAYILGIFTAAAVWCVAISMIVYTRLEPIVYWWGGSLPRDQAATGLGFVIDNAAGIMILIASTLVAAALIFSRRYFERPGAGFDALLLTLLAGASGIAETGDLLSLLFFFEVMAAAAYALCRYRGESDAMHFGVVNATGALMALGGIALLYARTGAINMAHIGRALEGSGDSLTGAAFALIACGFLIQAGIAPFHFGLIDGHMAASLPVCAVLSGVVAELGLYALTRIYWTCFSGGLDARQNDVRNLLAAFGAVSALLGAVLCYAQRDIKRLLAYSTVSQMGLMLLGISLLTPRGLAGSELLAMSHAMLKGGLFLSAGMLLRRAGDGDELQLTGRGCDFQWMAAFFFLGAAGLAAVPPFSSFWGANLLDGSARSLGYFWIPWLAFACYAISTAAIFRFSFRVFFGKRWRGEEFGVHSTLEPGSAKEAHRSTPVGLYGPAAALIALGLISGMAPRITGAAEAAAMHVQNRAAYARRVLDLLTPFPPVVQDQPATAGDIFRAALVLVIGVTTGWLAARGRVSPSRR